jgi:hypothetical protein
MNQLRRLRYTFIALIAVLCLLGMQQGAAFHGLSHLAGDDSAGQKKHLPHEKSCEKCVVYAEVGGGAPTTSLAPFKVSAQRAVIASPTHQQQPSISFPGYSARAPPLFL